MFVKIYYHTYSIQGHTYVIGATDKGLCFVGSRDQEVQEIEDFYPKAELQDDEQMVDQYANQIREYLVSKRQSFDMELDISGTKFQELVWQSLMKIPYGQTRDYSEIAKQIGKPKAARAVGSAIGKNPVLMVIPCHRVITKDKHVGHYRGGVDMKQELLTLEKN